jgi:PEP-CTERM motif
MTRLATILLGKLGYLTSWCVVTGGEEDKMTTLSSWCRTIGFIAVVSGVFSSIAFADEVVSLTAATACQSTNGNGGDWCQGNGGPAFNLSSFTTQNISTTGSSAFFAITNNTGVEKTTLTLDFIGTLMNGPATCGGGGTGIQGAGPGTAATICSISTINGGEAITWKNLDWGAGDTFDLQIASFSNGTVGVIETVPEPGTLSLLAVGIGMLGLMAFCRRNLAAQ